MAKDGKPIYKKWWLWAIVAFLIIAIGSCNRDSNQDGNNNVGNNANTTTTKEDTNNITEDNRQAEDTVEQAPDAQSKKEQDKQPEYIRAGMYKAGTDIAAGEYLLINDSPIMSYFQVTKDSSGTLESIIANDNFYGSRYVTVGENQYIEFRDSKMYPVASAPVLQPENGRYKEGMYKVGRDIPAGEYKVIPEGELGSYIEVSKDSRGVLDSIISNDNFTTEKYITIKDGQYIKLVSCYIQK